MATPITSNCISREFWDILHRMGLPKELTKAVITLEAGEIVKVSADFYLTSESGDLELVEGAFATGSADFVIVRAEEVAALEAKAAELVSVLSELAPDALQNIVHPAA